MGGTYNFTDKDIGEMIKSACITQKEIDYNTFISILQGVIDNLKERRDRKNEI